MTVVHRNCFLKGRPLQWKHVSRIYLQSGAGRAYKYCVGGLHHLSLTHCTYCHCDLVHTHPNISINYLLAPMRHFTPHVSSSHGSDSSNATQYTPNTCFYYPYGVSANGTHSAPPSYAPVAPSPGVGAGVMHHAFQTGQNGYYPNPGADVSCATYDGPYSLQTAATHPPQGPSATPLYHQPISFPGAANPYAALIPHQGYFHQNHGPVPATGSTFSSLPQAPSISQKRIAEHLHYCDVKQAKIAPGGMKDDPLFTPVLDQLGQPNGTFVCSRDGMVLNPGSYLKHLKTKKHLGFKLEKFKCSGCSKTYTRRDAYKRHLINSKCGQSIAVGAPPPYSASQNSTSSASVAPAMASTTALTYSHPYPMFPTSMSQNVEIAPPTAYISQSCGTPSFSNPEVFSSSPENNMVPEPAENDNNDDTGFWEANETKDGHEM